MFVPICFECTEVLCENLSLLLLLSHEVIVTSDAILPECLCMFQEDVLLLDRWKAAEQWSGLRGGSA